MGEVAQLTSITINPTELRRLSAPDAAEPSKLGEMTQKAEFLASAVENLWEEMPLKVRKPLITLAYLTLQPPKGFFDRYSTALRGSLRYAHIRLRGEQDAFFDYVVAYRRLTNAILGALERENPAYQRALSEAVEEAFSDLDRSEELTPEDTLEQLRQLSDEALREVQ
jgi:hypothetical protein